MKVIFNIQLILFIVKVMNADIRIYETLYPLLFIHCPKIISLLQQGLGS